MSNKIMSDPRQMISLKEIAHRLNVQVRTVRIAVREGRVEAVPVRYRKARGKNFSVPVDFRITRKEFARIEREGLRAPIDGGFA